MMNRREDYYIEWDENYPIENQYYEFLYEMLDIDPEYAYAGEGMVIEDEEFAEETEYNYYIGDD